MRECEGILQDVNLGGGKTTDYQQLTKTRFFTKIQPKIPRFSRIPPLRGGQEEFLPPLLQGEGRGEVKGV